MLTGPDGPNPYAAPRHFEELGPLPLPQGEVFVASRSRRLLGAIVDGFLYGIAFAPLLVVDAVDDPGDPVLLMLVLFVAIIGLQTWLVATTGQSVAKKLLGMRIVRLDGSACGFFYGVLMRSWVFGLLTMIPYIGSILSLVDAFAIFGSEHRCVHDVIAGTKVVMAEQA